MNKPNRTKYLRVCKFCKNLFTSIHKKHPTAGKFCSNICVTRYKAENVDQTGENNPNWKGGEFAGVKSKRKQKYPERYRAYVIYRRALNQGSLVRQPCEKCGSVKDIHGHHEDYSKPLEVRWLCKKHHEMEHGASESKIKS